VASVIALGGVGDGTGRQLMLRREGEASFHAMVGAMADRLGMARPTPGSADTRRDAPDVGPHAVYTLELHSRVAPPRPAAGGRPARASSARMDWTNCTRTRESGPPLSITSYLIHRHRRDPGIRHSGSDFACPPSAFGTATFGGTTDFSRHGLDRRRRPPPIDRCLHRQWRDGCSTARVYSNGCAEREAHRSTRSRAKRDRLLISDQGGPLRSATADE